MSRLIFRSPSSAVRARPSAVTWASGLLLSFAGAAPLRAQWVPGRDLLDLPIGTLAEAPALATGARVALWNPATLAARQSARASFGVAALATPADQGVSAQLLGASLRIRGAATVGLSVVRASVGDLLVTDEDPLSKGEMRYETTLVSAMAARRSGRHLATGIAVRYRAGQLGGTSRGVVALDGGVLLEGLGPRDGRLAASTFLWTPANQQEERTTFTGAGDLRLAGSHSAAELRGGYSFGVTERGVLEHFAFATGRRGVWEGRAGAARRAAFGDSQWRIRLGVGVYYARYAVAVSREDTGAGLDATYQFSLSSTIR